MDVNRQLDILARDIAIEVNLGGFRLGPEDLADRLDGVNPADLDAFMKRVRYHSVDFAPAGRRNDPQFLRWLDSHLGVWERSVRTVGERQEGYVSPLSKLPEDRGRYFLFPDGEVRICGKATSDIAWGSRDKGDLPLVPLQDADVVTYYCNVLCDKFGKEQGPKELRFLTDGFSERPLGHVVKVEARGDGFVFVVDADGDLSRHGPEDFNRRKLISILEDELQAQRERKMTLEEFRNDVRSVANDLVDYAGQRTRKDSLYDEVELVEAVDANYRYFISRQVDDLTDRDKRGLYLTYRPNGREGASMTSFSSLGFDQLSRLHRIINREFNARMNRGYKVSFQSPVKATLIDGTTVMVDKVFMDGNRLTMCGKAQPSGVDMQAPASEFTAMSVKHISDRSGEELGKLYAKLQSTRFKLESLKAENARSENRRQGKGLSFNKA